MALIVRYGLGGVTNGPAQNKAEQWDGTAGTYTAWDAAGNVTTTRAFTGAEAAQNAAIDAGNTATTNQAALLTKAANALAANATYQAISSPTTAQAVAQVAALTKQVNALIKLATQALSDTTGT